MTVRYEENAEGMFWVDEDGTQGEPQKDLHHAMRDYELTCAGLKESKTDEEQRVHTGAGVDFGSSEGSGGLIADNDGSAGEGEEADAYRDPEGTRGPQAGGSSEDDEDPDAGGAGPTL